MMKALVVVALMVMTAGAVVANDPPWGGVVGIFFDGPEYTGAHETNTDVWGGGWGAPVVYAYLVILNPSVTEMQYIEFSVQHPPWVIGFGNMTNLTPVQMFNLTEQMGPEAWSAILSWPGIVQLDPTATALVRFDLTNQHNGSGNLRLGPLAHQTPSRPNWVVIDSGGSFRRLTFSSGPCDSPEECEEVDEDGFVTIATFFGGGVVATEDYTLSGVKSLFR